MGMTRAEEDLLVETNMAIFKNKDLQIKILKLALETLIEKSVDVPMPYSMAIRGVCQIALHLQQAEADRILLGKETTQEKNDA